MTDQRSKLWRPEEGRASPLTSRPPLDASVPAEEPSDASSGVHTAATGSIWREDEGRLPDSALRDQAKYPIPMEVQQHREIEAAKDPIVSWRIVLVSTFSLLAVFMALDAVYALTGLRRELKSVAAGLVKVEENLSRGETERAEAALDEAEASARSADGYAARPSLRLGALIPGLDHDSEALSGLAGVAGLSTTAARDALEAAEGLRLDPEGTPQGLLQDGRVDLEVIETVYEEVLSGERLLLEAVLRLERLQPRFDQIRVPLADAREAALQALDRFSDARILLDVLPSMLGGDGDRRYLLAFQAPGEARPTGGLVGLYGTLDAEDGKLKLGKVGPYGEIQPQPIDPVDAPAWFEHSYSAQSALTQWQQANVSPNYPAVAEVLLEMYERATGEELDGVLAMDPIALESLMAGTGSIMMDGSFGTVEADEVRDLLLRRSYTEFANPETQNVFLSDLLEAFWEKFSTGRLDLEGLAKGLGDSLSSQHLKIYSRSENDRENLRALSVDGNYDRSGRPTQMVFNVNYGVNKVDYFLQRKIDTEVDLSETGVASVVTEIQLHNGAPAGPPSALLGSGDGLAPGTNRMTINVLMPPGSVVDSFEIGGEDEEAFIYLDDRSPVAWNILEIPPGKDETVTITYSISSTIALFNEGTVFDFTLFPQPTVNPDTFSLTIQPPSTSTVVEVQGGAIKDDGSVSFSGSIVETLPIRVEMVPR